MACLGLYCNSLGSWLFIDPGESYYTEAAREMVEGHEYIVPHLNYQTYYSKPILTFWLIAGSYNLFGVSEWAARLPFGLLACLLVALTVLACKSFADWKRALFAGFIAAAAPLMVAFAKTSPIDIAFSTFLNMAVFGFLLTCLVGLRQYFWLIWLGLSLAVLTKGPAGILLFGIGTCAYLAAALKNPSQILGLIRMTRPFLGTGIFAAICLPWYWAVAKATKGVFLKVFFEYENLARFQGKTNLHKGSPLYFISVLAYGLAPWALFTPQALRQKLFAPFFASLANLKHKRISTSESYKPHMTDAATQPASIDSQTRPQNEIAADCLLYLSAWLATVFVFFSISKTQLDTYILPIIAPLSIVLSCSLHDTLEGVERKNQEGRDPEEKNWDGRWAQILLWLIGGLSGAMAVGLAYLSATMADAGAYDRTLLAISSVVALIGSIISLMSIRAGRLIVAFHRQIITIAALFALLHPLGMQYFSYKNQQGMARVAAQLAGPLHLDKEEIALYGGYKPSIMYYLKRPVESISTVNPLIVNDSPLPDDGLSYGPTPSGKRQIVITDDAHRKDFAARPELHWIEIARDRDWAAYELLNGYVQKPKTLEEIFKMLIHTKHPLGDTGAFGPLTVPLGGGDAEVFKAKNAVRQQMHDRQNKQNAR